MVFYCLSWNQKCDLVLLKNHGDCSCKKCTDLDQTRHTIEYQLGLPALNYAPQQSAFLLNSEKLLAIVGSQHEATQKKIHEASRGPWDGLGIFPKTSYKLPSSTWGCTQGKKQVDKNNTIPPEEIVPQDGCYF